MTVQTKIRDLFAFLRFLFFSVAELTFYTIRTFKQYRLAAPKKWGTDAKQLIRKKLKQLHELWNAMTTQEKMNTLTDAVVVLAMVLIVGGGLDAEGGLPDTDLTGEIGKHRNLFTHTILIGLTFEFLIGFVVMLIAESRRRGFMPRSRFLRAILNFCEKHHVAAIRGMWLGLFLHFLKDSNFFHSRTKPYVGINNMSMRTHQNLFASNALLALIFSKQSSAEGKSNSVTQ